MEKRVKKKIGFLTVALCIFGSVYFQNNSNARMMGETIKVCPSSWVECNATYKGIEVKSEKCASCGAIEIENFE